MEVSLNVTVSLARALFPKKVAQQLAKVSAWRQKQRILEKPPRLFSQVLLFDH